MEVYPVTLQNYLKVSENTAQKIVDKINYQSRETTKASVALNLQQAFSEGAQSIIEAQSKKSKNVEGASKELEESLSDTYLFTNMEFFKEFMIRAISDVSTSGRLNIGWQDSISSSTEEFVKTIYDLAFINGIAVAQDPLKLKLYLKNKERAITHESEQQA